MMKNKLMILILYKFVFGKTFFEMRLQIHNCSLLFDGAHALQQKYTSQTLLLIKIWRVLIKDLKQKALSGNFTKHSDGEKRHHAKRLIKV